MTRLTRLKFRRMKAGVTQWRLAEQIGISETLLSKLESGRISPNEADAVTIAAALDSLPSELWAMADKVYVPLFVSSDEEDGAVHE